MTLSNTFAILLHKKSQWNSHVTNDEGEIAPDKVSFKAYKLIEYFLKITFAILFKNSQLNFPATNDKSLIYLGFVSYNKQNYFTKYLAVFVIFVIL